MKSVWVEHNKNGLHSCKVETLRSLDDVLDEYSGRGCIVTSYNRKRITKFDYLKHNIKKNLKTIFKGGKRNEDC